MSRPLRIQFLGAWYHLMNRDRKGEPVFLEKSELCVSWRGHYNEPRKIAIYLTRKLRGDSLGEIGEAFGIKKYSTVSSVIRRVKREIRKDRHLKKRVEELTGRLTKGQRQT